jgi:hypothetical protein
MWKRLQAVGTSLSYQHRQIIRVVSELDESDESFERRIERWKAGERVEGIEATFDGGAVDLLVVRRVLVRPRTGASA